MSCRSVFASCDAAYFFTERFLAAKFGPDVIGPDPRHNGWWAEESYLPRDASVRGRPNDGASGHDELEAHWGHMEIKIAAAR